MTYRNNGGVQVGELDAEQQQCDMEERHRVKCDSSSTILRDGQKKFMTDQLKAKLWKIGTNHLEKR